MRLHLIATFLLSHSATLFADVISSSEAWSYLTAPNSNLHWVVISTQNNGSYLQCENIRTVIRCPFPVWAKLVPGDRQTKPVNSRDTPFPEISGSELIEYIPAKKIPSLKKTLTRLGLKPNDVYSQAINRKRSVVGTSYDVTVILEMNYKGFDLFVQSVFSELGETASVDTYKYETGSWN